MSKKLRKVLIVILTTVTLLNLFCACGKKATYTITFDSLGGTAVDSQTVKEGKPVSKPADPTKEGFTFVEWQFENSTYDFDTPVTKDLTLTAYFTINEGTELVAVAYNADNGSGINTIQIAKGSSVTEPPIPIKHGYKFDGWYFADSKFDFSTKIDENILLVAKWCVDKSATTNSNSQSISSNDPTPSTPNNDSVDNKIKFTDVAGVWYAEGTDDVKLSFSVMDDTWIYIDTKNFNHNTCTIVMHGGTGGTEYFYDNGYFYSESITLESKEKLVYKKNNNTVIFYRKKDYPKAIEWPHEILLREINGYYWYLDGYKYTYLYPMIEENGLKWNSQNINIYNNTLTAYENYAYEEYKEINKSAQGNTYHTLLINPTEFAYTLIDKYNMDVKNNKLYMTVGGKTYTFTRFAAMKNVPLSLTTNVSSITKNIGDSFDIDISVSPFWSYHYITVTSSNPSVVSVQSGKATSEDGKLKRTFNATKAGTATLTFKDTKTNTTTSVFVTVSPNHVAGVTLNKSSIEIFKGDTETLIATVSPSDASNKEVTWSSSDTSVATVSSSGKITAKKYGTAIITVTTNDGGYSATCKVVVKQDPLTVKASIGISSRASSSSIVKGVIVEVQASGGSESYVAYSIKLYCNGEYVGTVSEKEMFVTPLKNGTYKVEVYVKDSKGNEATSTHTTTISQ